MTFDRLAYVGRLIRKDERICQSMARGGSTITIAERILRQGQVTLLGY